jgi:TetR/AcrR family transcriptional regulator
MPSNTSAQAPPKRPGRPAGSQAGEAREALLEAAHELMAEKGYPQVTLREVAERAGVHPALVSYHFGNKEGLLRSVVAAVAETMRGRIARAATGDETPEESIRNLIRGVVEAIMAAPYAPRLMVEQVLFGDSTVVEEFAERFARPNLAAILEILEAGRRSGRLRTVDPRFLVPAMMGACVFFFLGSPIHRRLYGIDETDAELSREFAEATAELLLHGLAASEGAAS